MARTFSQKLVDDLARYADVPVINGLTDMLHPCQAMADMMTIAEHLGGVNGKNIAFVGDGNNVARSLAWACARLGANFVNVGPQDYLLDSELIDQLQAEAPDLRFACTTDPAEALSNADVVYTDTWVSMGQEEQKDRRLRDFQGYQVNRQLLEHAPPQAVVMHDLPAYREVEISSEVLDSPRSIVLDQAENRLHFQRALLQVLLADRP
jgi:ornithine carbamoyltransferase